jgi:hypothetical protein
MATDRDWTVVLKAPCEECGADVQSIDAPHLSESLQTSIDEWVELLTGEGIDITKLVTRSTPTTWSPTEYACHVADVFDLMQQRIFLMISEDNPTFESWDPDIAATDGRYDTRSPSEAASLLVGASNRLSNVFDAMAPDLWVKTGVRGDGTAFTVLTISQYTLHDNLHHLFDVTRLLS